MVLYLKIFAEYHNPMWFIERKDTGLLRPYHNVERFTK